MDVLQNALFLIVKCLYIFVSSCLLDEQFMQRLLKSKASFLEIWMVIRMLVPGYVV